MVRCTLFLPPLEQTQHEASLPAHPNPKPLHSFPLHRAVPSGYWLGWPGLSVGGGMINPTHVAPTLRPALLHAVQNNDRRMLNQIELRLINQLHIVPADAQSHQHWTAVGIAEIGRNLLVQWEEKHSMSCNECGGTGFIEASGNTKTFDVECPECDGGGRIEPEIRFNQLYTDIDGISVELADPHLIDFIVPNGCTDELSQFLKALEEAAKVPV